MDPVVIIGESAPMKRVFEQVQKVAPLAVTVLITGETGTGKDLVASRIHQTSGRSGGPFVPVNVGAIPREPIGSTEFVASDVRILAASNQDLLEAIEEGSFREDLYYRLNVFSLEIPPLRERGEDILLLARHFLRHYAAELDRNVTAISVEAEKLLLSHSWPGNVRELENMILRTVVSAEGDTITETLLTGADDRQNMGEERIQIEVGSTLETLERSLIRLTLDHVMGSKTLAAEMLGLSRKGIYNKIKRYKL
jgi:transcriptional regulator with PAS, ATPase and Fis domain